MFSYVVTTTILLVVLLPTVLQLLTQSNTTHTLFSHLGIMSGGNAREMKTLLFTR